MTLEPLRLTRSARLQLGGRMLECGEFADERRVLLALPEQRKRLAADCAAFLSITAQAGIKSVTHLMLERQERGGIF
jgi:hypothetical protein